MQRSRVINIMSMENNNISCSHLRIFHKHAPTKRKSVLGVMKLVQKIKIMSRPQVFQTTSCFAGHNQSSNNQSVTAGRFYAYTKGKIYNFQMKPSNFLFDLFHISVIRETT